MAGEDEFSDEEGQLRPEVARRLAQDREVHEHEADGENLGGRRAPTLLQGARLVSSERLWVRTACSAQTRRPQRHAYQARASSARDCLPEFRSVRPAQDRQRPNPHRIAAGRHILFLFRHILRLPPPLPRVARERHVVESVPHRNPRLFSDLNRFGATATSRVDRVSQPASVERAPAPSRLAHQPRPAQVPVPKIGNRSTRRIGFHGFLPPKPPRETASPPSQYTMDQVLGRHRHTEPTSETEVIAPTAYAQGYSSVSQRPPPRASRGAWSSVPSSGCSLYPPGARTRAARRSGRARRTQGFAPAPAYFQPMSFSGSSDPLGLHDGPPQCGGR